MKLTRQSPEFPISSISADVANSSLFSRGIFLSPPQFKKNDGRTIDR